MNPILFRKYQAIGNDFILFDGLSTPLPLEKLTQPSAVKLLCDRHYGIGADGILLLLPAEIESAQVRYQIFNADGSEAEMCGNGIRCAAKALADYNDQFRHSSSITFETKAGIRPCDLKKGPDGLVNTVRVGMGHPEFAPNALPAIFKEPLIDGAIFIHGEQFIATAVSMGNPHLVIFNQSERPLNEIAGQFGPDLENHMLFPKRINVEFARISEEEIELCVWERGCGITLACGTGACATAVAAVKTRRWNGLNAIPIRLPGGKLTITLAEDLNYVWMEGPAEEVFVGNLSGLVS